MTNVTEEGRKRRELANFLRNRREKIKDIPKSFLGSSRRRTPGLRREEVAELAGVGSAWYTWLEQARDIQPSSEVLDRIGEALRLTLVEKRHLFCLAGKPIPSNFLTTVPALPESVKSFVENAIQAP
ncbi:MAG: helix-turn-helix transcriptional regulator, partial [Bdellovibrionia bacterium]